MIVYERDDLRIKKRTSFHVMSRWKKRPPVHVRLYMVAGLHVGETRSRYRRSNSKHRDIYSKFYERIIFE